MSATWIDYAEAYEGGAGRVSGTVKVLPRLESPQLGNERDLLVYLPPSYARGAGTYTTLYMHDGQNLFDEATSFAGEWRVDETLEDLGASGIEAIVVGIPNAGERRLAEYSPWVDPTYDGGLAAAYLRFVVETVKPLVDASFRTAPSRERTGVFGSSMGGLVSLFAFFERPEVFGLAGAMSPSVGFARQALVHYLESAPNIPGRIYMDVGTREGAPRHRDPLKLRPESSAYVRLVRRARDILERKGYRPGQDLLYVEEEGAVHDERAWARRLPDALRFLLR